MKFLKQNMEVLSRAELKEIKGAFELEEEIGDQLCGGWMTVCYTSEACCDGLYCEVTEPNPGRCNIAQ